MAEHQAKETSKLAELLPNDAPQHAALAASAEKKGAHAREKVTFNQAKPKAWRLYALIAAVLVPTLVAVLLIAGVFDPYGNFNQVPAVVVNHDRGAEIDGEQRNYGQELCDMLVNDNAEAVEGEVSGFGWNFVKNETTAAQGLRDGAYYVEIVIPENFSESIATVENSDAVQSELLVYYNPSLNYNAQVVGESVVERVIEALNKNIQESCFSNIFMSIKSAGSDLLTVANAGLDLTDGLVEAKDGSAQLADGAEQLADGSSTLTDGLYEAADGADQLSSGASQLVSGVIQLADGLGLLKDSLEQSSSSPETVALTKALSSVASNLQGYAEEMQKESPDPEVEQAYLDAAAQAAQEAAAANKTLGDPLVAYISGGTFSYTSGSVTVTSVEKGLIPALKEYIEAEEELQEFEYGELNPLLSKLQVLKEDLEDLGEVGQQAADDLEVYCDAVETYRDNTRAYRLAVLEYSTAHALHEAGQITADELAVYKAAMDEASDQLETAESAVCAAREQVKYDFYHEDETGEAAGLLPALEQLGEDSYAIVTHFTSLTEIEELINRLVTLITNEATAGAAAQGAAGKCEGYLVGVAVTSAYANGSMSQLTSAVAQIYAAVATGSDGQTSLVDGTSQLASGASSLAEGVYTAADGSNTITVNLGTVASGASTLADGLQTAATTSNTLFTGLLDGQKELEQSTENSDEHTSVLQSPVVADSENITTVPTMGTSMAPYYLGAGLWIGCIIAALILRTIDERRFSKNDSSLQIVAQGYWPLAVVALVQVAIGLAVLRFGLNMNVNYPVEYCLVGVAAALAFSAATQLMCGHFHLGGVIAAVILLAAQMCVASGLFPVQAGLSMAATASGFLPLSNVVSGLRVAMCGLASNGALVAALILFAYFIVCAAASVVVTLVRRKKAQADAAKGLLGAHAAGIAAPSEPEDNASCEPDVAPSEPEPEPADKADAFTVD